MSCNYFTSSIRSSVAKSVASSSGDTTLSASATRSASVLVARSRVSPSSTKATTVPSGRSSSPVYQLLPELQSLPSIKEVYLTLGRCDLVCVIDAPDDETLARVILQLGSAGNVQTETLKAFSEDQYRSIIKSL